MNKITDIAVEKLPVQNPKFPEFGENIPSRTNFLRVFEKVTKETELSSGDKIARFMTVHWGNQEKKVGFSFNEALGEFTFSLPTNIGEFFSISWAINDQILLEYGDQNIISFGFDKCQIGKKQKEQINMFGSLTLIKGKKNAKQTCAASYYEKRMQASFNMDDQKNLWETATRGWMDFVFADPKVRQIKITKPMIWIQSKMTL